MSDVRMTITEAMEIAENFLACEKRLRTCMGGCSKCKYEYSPAGMREAVRVMLGFVREQAPFDDEVAE